MCSENEKFFFVRMGAGAGRGTSRGGAGRVWPLARVRELPNDFAGGAHQSEPWVPAEPSFRVADLRGPAARRKVVRGAPFPRRPKQKGMRGPGGATDNPTLGALQQPQTRTAALSEDGQETGLPPPSCSPQARPGASWGGPQGATGAGRSGAGSHEDLGLCSFLL